MNKIFITFSALVLSVLPFSSCRDFDEVNRDPLAAHRDQVLSEYLINRAMMTAQHDHREPQAPLSGHRYLRGEDPLGLCQGLRAHPAGCGSGMASLYALGDL